MGIGEKNKSKGKVTEETKRGMGMKNKKDEGVKHEEYLKVWDRTEGCCELCGSNQMVQAHHAFRRRELPYWGQERHEAWNLIMLCSKGEDSCHKKAEVSGTEEDRKAKQKALQRYSGDNKGRLKEIYKNKFGEEF